MDTDIHCKVLARLRPTDLLALTDDRQAQILSTDTVELPEMRRTVDLVYKLQWGREIYYRHIEFQAQFDPKMNERCLLYNTRLIVQYQVPVITTIIYSFPQRQPPEPVFRVELRGKEINRWRFDCVRLWELEAETGLQQGLVGLAALVPLMSGGTLKRIEQAAQQIEATAPESQQSDLLAILHAFAETKYTVKQLERVIGREQIMESWIYQQGRAEGRTEGRTEGLMQGQLEATRELCRAAVRKWRPRAGTKVWEAIDNCVDVAALKEVNLNASEWTTREIIRRLTEQ